MPAGVLNYRYDQMGREAAAHLHPGRHRLHHRQRLRHRRPAALAADYPDGDAVGSALDPITYDAAGRLAAIPGLVTAATYDASGNAETFTRANGVVSTYGHSDQRGWLDSLTTLSGATSIQALTYTRDAAGQITAVASAHADESWTYGYDALRRLLSATNTDTPAYNRTYTYDSIGNMLSNSGIAGSYSYPAPGSPRPHAVTSAGSWTYSYDANGNMTVGAGRTFTYNGDNRPTQIDTQNYSYGPDGERWKTVDSSPGGGTTLYLGGSIEIASGVMTKYLPGNAKRVGSPGDPLVETFWLHHDHQGSIQAITDAAGIQVQRFTYYPYGDRVATASAHEESKGWIGERQDTTGLFYLHARYYDPVIGRFNTADPSDPLAPGVGLNRYAYAGNNPIMRVDPWGLEFGTNAERGYADEEGYEDDGRGYSSRGGGFERGEDSWDRYEKTRRDRMNWFEYQLDKLDRYARTQDALDSMCNGCVRDADWVFAPAGGFGGIGIKGSVAGVRAGVGATKGWWDDIAGWGARQARNVRDWVRGGRRGNRGDLTDDEVRAIQEVVDEAQRPLEVVGSAARGQRRNIDSELPIGKGPGTRSDTDYTTAGSSIDEFRGLEPKLPNANPQNPILRGTTDPQQGPGIRFEPGQTPRYIPAE